MRLGPGRWRILVQGDERPFGLFPWNRRGLDYLLSRLLSGEDVAPGEGRAGRRHRGKAHDFIDDQLAHEQHGERLQR